MLEHFKEIWLCDFEFQTSPGECPIPVCMVAMEYRSKRIIRLFGDELRRHKQAPFDVGPMSLFVAFYASAEFGCFLTLGWPLPAHVLDLFVEFRALYNGRRPKDGYGLLSAMVNYGLDHIDVLEKAEMRALAMRGGPYTGEERAALLDYCQADTDALNQLLPCMEPHLDCLGWVCLRGRYMRAVAHMEHIGVQLDLPLLTALRDNWSFLKQRLVDQINPQYGVFEGVHFRFKLFKSLLARLGLSWPRTPSGLPATDDDTFREMAKLYPVIAPLHELKATLGKMRLQDLAVGADGRNRAMLSAFRASSGRNAPSSKKFVFGPAVWLRGLIRPSLGYAMAYLAYASEAFGIGAVLSGDHNMIEAYRSGDPYLAFAKQVKAVPEDATKKTHGPVRDLFKQVCLGINYGMEAESLGYRIGRSTREAKALLRAHREAFSTFWRWSDGAVNHATFQRELHTVFGWPMHYKAQANPRSQRNFLLQANGAELLRLACCLVTEGGVRVVAPVHDALLIEAPVHCFDEHVAFAENAMRQASRYVLDGFELAVETKPIRWPDRFQDDRGAVMWQTITGLLRELLGEGADAEVAA